MLCPYCATENDPQAQNCSLCGARLVRPEKPKKESPEPKNKPEPIQIYTDGVSPEPEAEAVSRKRRQFPRLPKKLIRGLLIAAALAALGILTALLVPRLPEPPAENPGFYPQEVTWQIFLKDVPMQTLIVRDDIPVANGPEQGLHPWLLSGDNRVLCLRTETGRVYLIREEEARVIGDNVVYATLSGDGSALACIDEDGILSLYNEDYPEGHRVARPVAGASLAPDGSAMVFYTLKDKGTPEIYLYTQGETRLLTRDLIPFALTAGGSRIYCRGSKNDGLYVLDPQGESTRLSSGLDADSPIYLNRDHSQILFRARGQHYAVTAGDEKYRVCTEGPFTMADPINHTKTLRVEGGCSLITLATDALNGKFYTGGTSLFYLDEAWEPHLISQEADSRRVQMTWDGQILYYLSQGNLFRVDAGSQEAPQPVAGDVHDYAITASGEALYFMDSEGSVWYRTPKAMPILVAEGARTLHLTHDDHCLILTEDGERGFLAHASFAGSAAQPLISHVHEIRMTPTAVYVSRYYDPRTGLCDIYAATEGLTFTQIVDAP